MKSVSVSALLILSIVHFETSPCKALIQGGYSSEFIFQNAPFPSCHASTIVETNKTLLAAWFGGTAESNPDVGIWLSRHVNGKWTAPVEVATGADGSKRYPCWNPVLFQPQKGPLMLFYKVGPWPNNWWGMVKTSIDGGQTWSSAHRLPNGILGPIKNKPIQLRNGIIVSPSSLESDQEGWRVHMERSADGGKTWTATPALNDGKTIGAIQPSLLQRENGTLVAVGRTRQGKVFHIESIDDGQTWGTMTLSDTPNPNSGTDALTLQDGRHLLIYNHTPRSRSPLNVALSNDGIHWKALLTLENGDGEFSYPAAIQTADGQVHITYTWNRKLIKHVTLAPKVLREPVVKNEKVGFILKSGPYKHLWTSSMPPFPKMSPTLSPTAIPGSG